MSISNAIQRFSELAPLVVVRQIGIDWLSAQSQQGDRRSTKKGGTGREFVDFRRYRFGDDMRRLNWKEYGKRPENPIVTLFEEEVTANIVVFTDMSQTMDMASVSISKRELAAVLTASILRSAARTSDKGQFTAFCETGIVKRFSKRSARRLNLAPYVVLDDEFELEEETPTAMQRTFSEFRGDKSLVFVVSDFLGRTPAAMEALQKLAVHHEVVCLVVQDLRERELPAAKLLPFLPVPGLYTVTDAAGNSKTIFTTARARQEHRERFDAAESKLFDELKAAGCKYARVRTDYDAVTLREKLSRIFAGRRGKLDLNN